MEATFSDESPRDSANTLTLDSVREALIRQEDTIVFSLIERAKFKRNPSIYDKSSGSIPGWSGSLLEFVVKETEMLHAKAGRYGNPEEHAFFPDDLPIPIYPHDFPQVLHPAAPSININKDILNMYVNELLPLFTAEGDDANHASTAACDLVCLQALSKRIHYGMYVAEVKFSDAPQDYGPPIHAKDRDTLMKMLTFEAVEEMVKRRVEKKAMVFGQEVRLDDKGDKGQYKVNPSVVSRFYGEWVMPMTKVVEVEYLLRRLDRNCFPMP